MPCLATQLNIKDFSWQNDLWCWPSLQHWYHRFLAKDGRDVMFGLQDVGCLLGMFGLQQQTPPASHGPQSLQVWWPEDAPFLTSFHKVRRWELRCTTKCCDILCCPGLKPPIPTTNMHGSRIRHQLQKSTRVLRGFLHASINVATVLAQPQHLRLSLVGRHQRHNQC